MTNALNFESWKDKLRELYDDVRYVTCPGGEIEAHTPAEGWVGSYIDDKAAEDFRYKNRFCSIVIGEEQEYFDLED